MEQRDARLVGNPGFRATVAILGPQINLHCCARRLRDELIKFVTGGHNSRNVLSWLGHQALDVQSWVCRIKMHNSTRSVQCIAVRVSLLVPDILGIERQALTQSKWSIVDGNDIEANGSVLERHDCRSTYNDTKSAL